jgi:hypothetical protein
MNKLSHFKSRLCIFVFLYFCIFEFLNFFLWYSFCVLCVRQSDFVLTQCQSAKARVMTSRTSLLRSPLAATRLMASLAAFW